MLEKNRMTKKCILGIIILIISLFSCEEKKDNIWGEYDLTIKEIRSNKKLAIAGDGDAAFKLAMYYESVNLDFDRYIYWLNIGADNENSECLFLKSKAYFDSNDYNEVVNAFEDMEKAASMGNMNAYDFLLGDRILFVHNKDLNLYIGVYLINKITLDVSGEPHYFVFGKIQIENLNNRKIDYNFNNIYLKSPFGEKSSRIQLNNNKSNKISIQQGEIKDFYCFWKLKEINESFSLKDLEVKI